MTIIVFKILNTKPKWKDYAEVPGVDDRITLYCMQRIRFKYINDVQRGQDKTQSPAAVNAVIRFWIL